MSLIFVSVVSVCNDDIEYMLEDLCKKARFPETLKIVVNIQDEVSKLQYYEERFSDNPHIHLITREFDGRNERISMCAENTTYIDNEQYFLQLSPDQRFVLHWDIICIHMFGQCFKSEFTNDKKAVLTSVGAPVSLFQRDIELCKTPAIPHQIQFDYIEDDTLYLKSIPIEHHSIRRIPIRTFIMNSNFIFTTITWAKSIKYVPSWDLLNENMLLSMCSFLCGWEIFNAYELLNYETEKTLNEDDQVSTSLQQMVIEFIENNELKIRRSLQDYTLLSGYDCTQHTFVEINTDFVKDETIWKNLYNNVNTTPQFTVGRNGKNTIIVSNATQTSSKKNHYMYGRRHDYSVVYTNTNLTHEEIINAFPSYKYILILTDSVIFTLFSSSVRKFVNTFKLDFASKSYVCSSGQITFYGPCRAEVVVKKDFCVNQYSHVFRRDCFMCCVDVDPEPIFSNFNTKYLLF